MDRDKIINLVSQMTLEEKASLCSGADFWHTEGVERLGIPKTLVSDGPHGLRKQKDGETDHLGLNEAIKAVCFPAGCAMASTFNRELLTEQGEHLGTECQAEGVSVLLGPAMNIKRSPLCGRNFEYLSEDPYVASELSTALVKGVQSKNVGTSPKHFAMNSQETRRMSVSSEADQRTMREIYLAAFEGMVKEAKPWTMMCSYNKINGTYAASNQWLLTDVLRKEWGFDGYVMSDWGAVDRRLSSLKAGLNLEMPGSSDRNDQLIVEAVKKGELDEAFLDESVAELLNIVFKYQENHDETAVFDYEGGHKMSQKVAQESMVLLKNDGILPLSETEDIVFIGKYATSPRYQGGGSSHVNSFKITSAVDSTAGMKNVSFAQGFNDEKDEIDEAMVAEAVEAAKKAKVAVIFAGLPDSFESEGYDRKHMRMPDNQNYLIQEVVKVQPNTVVLLHNGSPVEMPWIDDVKAILECYLGGQAVGTAQVNILFGKVNPSGKLAESFPRKLADNPAHLNFPGEGDIVEFKEGIFVGYRYYDYKETDLLFPFGFGLSYTTFAYSNMTVDKTSMKDTDTVLVTVDVTNTGKVAGKEIVQLYVADQVSFVIRPKKELKGFEKIELAPGETKTVTFTLGKRSFAYWNIELGDWHVESGEFDLLIGKSCREIECQKTITVESEQSIPHIYTPDSLLKDMMRDPDLKEFMAEFMQKVNNSGQDIGQSLGDGNADGGSLSQEMIAAIIDYIPFRAFGGFIGSFNADMIEDMCDQVNEIKKQKTLR